MIHLYVNPTARREWCRKNSQQFFVPNQQGDHQPQHLDHPPPYDYNSYGSPQYNPGYTYDQRYAS